MRHQQSPNFYIFFQTYQKSIQNIWQTIAKNRKLSYLKVCIIRVSLVLDTSATANQLKL